MPRPKGSKNKKTSTAAQVKSDITEKDALIEQLTKKVSAITREIEERKADLKAAKKDLRAAEKAKAVLETKLQEAEAIESAQAKKAEIETVVSKLVSSGKSAEDILAALNTI